MKAKDYLMQVRKADRLIDCKLNEIESLRSMLTSMTSAAKDVVVKSSGSDDKMGSTIAKIIDMQSGINDEIDRYISIKHEVMGIIDRLDYPFSELLYRRYFKYEKWEEIALAMNYSFRQTTRLHGKALRMVDDILKNE